MRLGTYGIIQAPRIKLCRTCGENAVERERDLICSPCRVLSYDRWVTRRQAEARTRAQRKQPKPPKPRLDTVYDLGWACRDAGLTISDIAEIARNRAT